MKTKVLILFLLLVDAPLAFAQNTMTATFDYDFTSFPPCSATLTASCTDHFEIWDITIPQGGTATPVVLFTIPLPAGATGLVHGISGSGTVSLPLGARTIAVVAMDKAGNGTFVNSDPNAASVAVTIRPGAPVNLNVTVK